MVAFILELYPDFLPELNYFVQKIYDHLPSDNLREHTALATIVCWAMGSCLIDKTNQQTVYQLQFDMCR